MADETDNSCKKVSFEDAFDAIMKIAAPENPRPRGGATRFFIENKEAILSAKAAGATWKQVGQWFKEQGYPVTHGALRNIAVQETTPGERKSYFAKAFPKTDGGADER